MKAIEQIVQAWEKRKHQLIDDALTARGKLDNELYALSREWNHNLKDEYDALMLIMDELNFSTNYFEDKQFFSDVHSELLSKISAQNNGYREVLEPKYKELITDLDATYEGIVNRLK
ncbi:MAG: hypothetical protein ABS949_08200 [Solibacillus sp.]